MPPFVPAVANSTACVKGLYATGVCISGTPPATLKNNIDTVDSDATKAQSAATAAAGLYY
jgi:hypothetical protein